MERKNVEKFGLPSNFLLFFEIAETVPAIIDSTTQNFLKKYEKYIEYFHFTDQYAGAKPQEYVFFKFKIRILEKRQQVYRKLHLL